MFALSCSRTGVDLTNYCDQHVSDVFKSLDADKSCKPVWKNRVLDFWQVACGEHEEGAWVLGEEGAKVVVHLFAIELELSCWSCCFR